MCLIVDEEKTQKMKKEKGSRTVWKVYRVFHKGESYAVVGSPIRINNPKIKSGRIISNRSTVKFPSFFNGSKDDCVSSALYGKRTAIYIGIHVCLTREAARQYIRDLKWDYDEDTFVIFRCEGDMSKFVAAGSTRYISRHNNQAVFKQIFVSPEDWTKALKGDFR